MISRLMQWERKFYWLDGGGGGGGGGDGDSDGVDGEDGDGAAAATGGGGPESLERTLEAVGTETNVPSREAKPPEAKKEETTVKKKRRPTLLTQLEGLLTASGIRRSLIGK